MIKTDDRLLFERYKSIYKEAITLDSVATHYEQLFNSYSNKYNLESPIGDGIVEVDQQGLSFIVDCLSMDQINHIYGGGTDISQHVRDHIDLVREALKYIGVTDVGEVSTDSQTMSIKPSGSSFSVVAYSTDMLAIEVNIKNGDNLIEQQPEKALRIFDGLVAKIYEAISYLQHEIVHNFNER